jgi:hypothetical protein
MATLAQCRAELRKLGLQLDESVSGWTARDGGAATIDPIGRMSIGPDCRGQFVFNYTASASEFWQEVIDEARDIAPTLCPCPQPVGECEFHDDEGDQP